MSVVNVPAVLTERKNANVVQAQGNVRAYANKSQPTSQAVVLKYVSLFTLIIQTNCAVLLTRYATIRFTKDLEYYRSVKALQPEMVLEEPKQFYSVVVVAIQEFLKMFFSVCLVFCLDYHTCGNGSGGVGNVGNARGDRASVETDLVDQSAAIKIQIKDKDVPFPFQGDDLEHWASKSTSMSLRAILRSLQYRFRFLKMTFFFQIVQQPKEALKILLPAACYTLQNNLIYFSLSHMDAAAFQICYQSKVIFTGVLSVMCIPNRSLSRKKWFSLFILTVGIICTQIVPDDTATVSTKSGINAHTLLGVSSALLAALCSGCAGVYFEKVLKRTFSEVPMNSGGSAPHGHQKTFENARHLQQAYIRLLGLLETCETKYGILAYTLAITEERAELSPHTVKIQLKEIATYHLDDNMVEYLSAADEEFIHSMNTNIHLLNAVQASVWMRNFELGFYSLVISVFSTFLFFRRLKASQQEKATVGSTNQHPMQGLSLLVWIIILFQSFGGLLIALVIKYADNVLKCFATALSIIVCSVCSYLLFDDKQSQSIANGLFIIGCVLVVISTFMYA